jgi:hypothetical protein
MASAKLARVIPMAAPREMCHSGGCDRQVQIVRANIGKVHNHGWIVRGRNRPPTPNGERAISRPEVKKRLLGHRLGLDRSRWCC